MKICTCCKIEKDESCFRMEGARKCSQCTECKSRKYKEYYRKNKKKVAFNTSKYRGNNREKINEYAAEYRKNNREKMKVSQKRHYENNKEKISAAGRKYREANIEKFKLYRKNNRKNNGDKVRFNAAKGQIIRGNRIEAQTPKDQTRIEKSLMRSLKIMARILSKTCKEPYQVDHIIPLSRGGPHTFENLRIVTAKENMAKGSKII